MSHFKILGGDFSKETSLFNYVWSIISVVRTQAGIYAQIRYL